MTLVLCGTFECTQNIAGKCSCNASEENIAGNGFGFCHKNDDVYEKPNTNSKEVILL